MKLVQLAGIAAVAMIPLAARGQSCPPLPDLSPAWFEFQVDNPARYVGDAKRIPRPDLSLTERRPVSDTFALLQFIVDTAGIPLVTSGKMLVSPKGLVQDSVAAAMQGWRYTPAILKGCKVPQLVMTPIRWR